jgi:hypothetical protein
VIPVVQSVVGDGRDGRPMGDCFRACVASIFELPLDEVPHFVEGPSWWRDFGRWVAEVLPGVRPCNTTYRKPEGEGAARRLVFDKSPDYPKESRPGYWIGCVMSENFGDDATHAVVMLDGEVAHDPSPHPRRTPYEFVGGTWFAAADPAALRRRAL